MGNDFSEPPWLPTRWLVIGTTAVTTVVGDMLVAFTGPSEATGSLDAFFIVGLVIALIPTIIFAFGVRTAANAQTYGSILLGTTLAAWFLVVVTGSAFAVLFWLGSLVAAIVGAVNDQRVRR